jgi:tripartite-type tricarboxylate transporter receptor subunit TctC
MNRKTFHAALLAALLGLSMTAGAQQSDAPIRILVGFPPGGSTDTVARVLASKLALELKQPIVIENKPGAGGRLAAQALKASAPDGLSYMIAPNATPVFQTLLYPPATLRYDMLKDFVPVAVIVTYPLALAVGAETGVGSAKEYAAWVKAHPEKASFGTAGAGGQTHFTGIQLGKAIGATLQVVPYRGNGPLVTDLLGGQVPAGIMTAGDIMAYKSAGKVRIVGVFGDRRSPLMPDVPTFKEQGVDIDAGDAWTGMWAPANTPNGQIERMQKALQQVLEQPEIRDLLSHKATLNPDFRPGQEMDKLQRKELAYWAPIIKASGFTPDE